MRRFPNVGAPYVFLMPPGQNWHRNSTGQAPRLDPKPAACLLSEVVAHRMQDMQTLEHSTLPTGSLCDLVTPFFAGLVDEAAIDWLVRWQIACGTSGIAVCAQAGEPTSLTAEERARVIRAAVRAAEGRVAVLAGTGTNSTATTISLTRNAAALGATAALVTVPYYSKPSQTGIVEHFRQLDAATPVPVLIWNAPGLTAVDLSVETLALLADLPSVAGLVDASGQIERYFRMPPDLRARLPVYAGHDATALAMRMLGARGAVSVAANVVPKDLAAMHAAADEGDLATARSIHDRLTQFMKLLEAEPMPVGVKHALDILFDLLPNVRLPLLQADAATRASLAAMVAAPVVPRSARSGDGRL